MGYYVSTMIGIRTRGVFGGNTDMDDFRQRVLALIKEMKDGEYPPDLALDATEYLSTELHAHKGSYVVIAGVFNYWTFKQSSEFARRLSQEFGTEVMIMSWDEEINTVQNQIYLDGKPLFETAENPIGRIMRRVG